MAKLFNLVQYIERDSNGNLRLRVERFDDIRQSNVILTEHVDTGVAEMINTDTLYSTVVLGSKDEDLDGYFSFTPFLSTFEEQYAMSYKSNINKELDLRMKAFITDTNLIYYTQTQQGLADPDSSNDDEVFYIICRRYNGVDWDEKGTLYFSGEYYLNADISNQNVLINNFTGLPATIFKQYVSLFTTGFYANSSGPYIQQPTIANTPFEFDLLELIASNSPLGANWNGISTGVFGTGIVPSNEFYCQWDNDSVAPAFDGGGNYNNSTYEYTIPATGYYVFYGLLDLIVRADLGLLSYSLNLNLWRTDASYITGNVLAQFSDTINNFILTPPNSFVFKKIKMEAFSIPLLLNANDKIFLTIDLNANSRTQLFLYESSHFTLRFTNVEGGDAVEVQDGNNYLLKNEWTGNVPLPNWQQILAAPFSMLRYQVNDAGEQRNMWVLDMTRNLISGVTEAQLTGRLVDEVPPEFENLEPGEGPEEG